MNNEQLILFWNYFYGVGSSSYNINNKYDKYYENNKSYKYLDEAGREVSVPDVVTGNVIELKNDVVVSTDGVWVGENKTDITGRLVDLYNDTVITSDGIWVIDNGVANKVASGKFKSSVGNNVNFGFTYTDEYKVFLILDKNVEEIENTWLSVHDSSSTAITTVNDRLFIVDSVASKYYEIDSLTDVVACSLLDYTNMIIVHGGGYRVLNIENGVEKESFNNENNKKITDCRINKDGSFYLITEDNVISCLYDYVIESNVGDKIIGELSTVGYAFVLHGEDNSLKVVRDGEFTNYRTTLENPEMPACMRYVYSVENNSLFRIDTSSSSPTTAGVGVVRVFKIRNSAQRFVAKKDDGSYILISPTNHSSLNISGEDIYDYCVTSTSACILITDVGFESSFGYKFEGNFDGMTYPYRANNAISYNKDSVIMHSNITTASPRSNDITELFGVSSDGTAGIKKIWGEDPNGIGYLAVNIDGDTFFGSGTTTLENIGKLNLVDAVTLDRKVFYATDGEKLYIINNNGSRDVVEINYGRSRDDSPIVFIKEMFYGYIGSNVAFFRSDETVYSVNSDGVVGVVWKKDTANISEAYVSYTAFGATKPLLAINTEDGLTRFVSGFGERTLEKSDSFTVDDSGNVRFRVEE